MAVQAQYLAYLLEQLAGLGALRSNRMFGGIGLYSRELFFGLIDDDTVYFKTDATNAAPYLERKMPRFMPFPGRPDSVLGYHQVPADVIEDPETLVEWARKSVAVALSSQIAKAAKPRKKTGSGKQRAPAKRARAKQPSTRKVPARTARKKVARRAK
jgi:DNA transformation protein and related proteins